MNLLPSIYSVFYLFSYNKYILSSHMFSTSDFRNENVDVLYRLSLDVYSKFSFASNMFDLDIICFLES
jgi:hypothetical protein